MYDPAPYVGIVVLLAVGLVISYLVGYRTSGVLRFLSYGRRSFSASDPGVRYLRALGRVVFWLDVVNLATHFLVHL